MSQSLMIINRQECAKHSSQICSSPGCIMRHTASFVTYVYTTKITQ